MSLSKEDRAIIKEQWEQGSPLSREITATLMKEGYLKMPQYRIGWGLAAWLKIFVLREIDQILNDGREK